MSPLGGFDDHRGGFDDGDRDRAELQAELADGFDDISDTTR